MEEVTASKVLDQFEVLGRLLRLKGELAWIEKKTEV
jgi:hypothetical protein